MRYPFIDDDRPADPPWPVGSPLARFSAGVLTIPATAGLYVAFAMWALALASAADCLGGEDAPPVVGSAAGCVALGIGFALVVMIIVSLAKYASGLRAPRARTLVTVTVACVLLSTAPFIYVYGGWRDAPANCDGLQMS